ncbi:unnamed protein product [Leptidea sinapis]|uniref:LIM zinc-binding domain-containing protein n=1 Tax=Leptidea sinapis TaxID=189913 RepID=A0A5E4QRB6_9NEOP|nr:unnamed protein product [Leptidea sinapis]
MDSSQESKKCFCARCFLPVDGDDKVEIEGQNFHRLCCMCCICRTIPTNLKMFYGHVFCNDCFKTHVMSRFQGEPRVHSNSWWMHWAPGSKPQEKMSEEDSKTSTSSTEEAPKRCICSRCLQPVDTDQVDIGGQSFHAQCAKCYFCHCVPKNNLKIYYGQVFCEDCFHRHVMSRHQDNPSEFFRSCFEQWQSSPQFAENMRDFMAGSRDASPFIFMMQGQQPFCRYGTGPQDWFDEASRSEPKKCA